MLADEKEFFFDQKKIFSCHLRMALSSQPILDWKYIYIK